MKIINIRNRLIVLYFFIMTLTNVVMAADYAAQAAQAHKAGQHARASTLYKAALRSDRENIALLLNIVECETVLGYLDDAMTYAERARAVSPQSIDVLLAMGYLQQRKDNWEEARATYESVLALEPKNPTALIRMSEVLVRLGDQAAVQGYLDTFDSLVTQNKAGGE